MAGPSWLVDPSRIATKIRSASAAIDAGKVNWKSNPSKSCPNCKFVIDNSDVVHAWPGLPRGVKFDPSDQEIILHLLAKAGLGNVKPHPFIDEFIPTVNEDEGICYTHPQNLPGVKQDGSVSHFFHRAIKAYSTGTRKRRKIHGDDSGDVRWHKTGRTKPVLLEGVQKGCKKIMVLYVSPVRGGKADKTNWVMHQYHLGTGEDEREGEYVISKVFYQQQQGKLAERSEDDVSGNFDCVIAKVDPVTPKSATPEPRAGSRFSDCELVRDSIIPIAEDQNEGLMKEHQNEGLMEEHQNEGLMEEHQIEGLMEEHQIEDLMQDIVGLVDQSHDLNQINVENHDDQVGDKSDDEAGEEDAKWWENESQYLLSSQQLVEGLSLCDELLQSQSPNRDDDGSGNGEGLNRKSKPLLSDYARLGPEDLKRDLEECQNLASDPANIDLDTPPDFRLSQLEFESQDSYIAWGGSVRAGKTNDE